MSGFHWAMSSQSYFDVVSVDYQTCLCNIPQLLMWDFLLQNGWSKPTNSWQEAISRKQSWLAFLQTTSGFEIYPLAPIPETKQPRNDHWKSWSPWKTCLCFFFPQLFGHSHMIQSIWVLTISNHFITNLAFFQRLQISFQRCELLLSFSHLLKKLVERRLSGNARVSNCSRCWSLIFLLKSELIRWFRTWKSSWLSWF